MRTACKGAAQACFGGCITIRTPMIASKSASHAAQVMHSAHDGGVQVVPPPGTEAAAEGDGAKPDTDDAILERLMRR